LRRVRLASSAWHHTHTHTLTLDWVRNTTQVVAVVLGEFVAEGGELGGGGGAAVRVAMHAARRVNVSLHLPATLNVSGLLHGINRTNTAVVTAEVPPELPVGPPDVVFWKLLKVCGGQPFPSRLTLTVLNPKPKKGLVGASGALSSGQHVSGGGRMCCSGCNGAVPCRRAIRV
jgi:hypothetical protein